MISLNRLRYHELNTHKVTESPRIQSARPRATDLLLGPVAAAACETRRTSSSDLLLPLVRLQEKKLPMMGADDCFWDMVADFTDGRSDQDLDALFHPSVFDTWPSGVRLISGAMMMNDDRRGRGTGGQERPRADTDARRQPP
jgi:hypothetical protein